ncbi:MAG: DinB family protein [bacterium]
MSERAQLLKELKQAHDGDPWHGPSRAAILADVTLGEATRHPDGSAHSIWQLVLHMRAWTNEVARRVREGNPGEPKEGDWPPVGETSVTTWAAALAGLERAHANLSAAVRELHDGQLDERVGGQRDAPLGTGVTHREMLHGLAQHDAYHSGQIALLKRLYR